MAIFLVTTSAKIVEEMRQVYQGRVFMVDGTVPGWEPQEGDGHWDHHKKGGKPIQIDEMRGKLPHVSTNDLIVTTQVDADACVAAAWLLLQSLDEWTSLPNRLDIKFRLSAIAHDCDHLYVPEMSDYGHLAEFGARAVADLKQQGFKIAAELGLPKNRKEWTGEQKEQYASLGFQRGTHWLVDAALGKRDWPGTSPDAERYWEGVEADTQMLITEGRVWLSESGKSVIYSTKGIDRYIDPRCSLKAISALGLKPALPIVLAVRDFQDRQNKGLSGLSFTPGSNPMHRLANKLDYSAAGTWRLFNHEEADNRGLDASEVDNHWDFENETALPTFEEFFGFSPWGGRDKVGGSGWNSPSLLETDAVSSLLEDIIERYIKSLAEIS